MATLKKALAALLIAPIREMRYAILEGRKKLTILEGHCEGYEVGRPVMLCCPDDPWCVRAKITAVRYCLLSEVTPEEWEADGFASRLLEGLPEMTQDSAVTIIGWDNVEGKLVNDWAELRKSDWVLQN